MTTQQKKKGTFPYPFRIKWNSTFGRHLVASSTIAAGELILEEPAIVQGPSPSSLLYIASTRFTVSVCPSCFAHFNYTDTAACSCSKCSLPMCSNACSMDSVHVDNECKIFQALPELRSLLMISSTDNKKTHLYQFITVLRCLSTKCQDPVKWKQILQLQSNPPILADSSLKHVIKLLSWELFNPKRPRASAKGETVIQQEVDEEDAATMGFHCLGALQTNSFSELQKSRSVENLYFFTSLLAHSCDINSERQFDPFSSRVVVSAIKEIKTGEPITVTYLPLCYSTVERQRLLSSPQWAFTCCCPRCEDPTEFGTFLGTLQCPSCKTLSLCPSRESRDLMTCCSCRGAFTASSVESVQKLKTALEELEKTKDLRNWLEGMEKAHWIHPNHSILTQVKTQLSQSLGKTQDGIRGISLEELERKRRYAEDVLAVINKLFPKGTVYFLKGIFIT